MILAPRGETFKCDYPGIEGYHRISAVEVIVINSIPYISKLKRNDRRHQVMFDIDISYVTALSRKEKLYEVKYYNYLWSGHAKDSNDAKRIAWLMMRPAL
jgi:hypothetical protein